MKLTFLKIFIILLLVADLGYSFIQHLNFPLDGDMAGIILPAEWYSEVLQDPFGLDVLLHNHIYANPNRFFAHWSLSKYFKEIPTALQVVFSPIDSVYFACAIAKTFVQAALIFLISLFITGSAKINFKFLCVALIVTPFFQSTGYYEVMGIIDRSITYTFFYALSMLPILLFFLPFFLHLFHQKPLKINWIVRVGLIALIVIIAFNGPLAPALLAVVCSLVLFNLWIINFRKNKNYSFFNKIFLAINEIPKEILFYFSIAIITSMYSLYIGTYNVESLGTIVPIGERYILLIKGIKMHFTYQLGLGILIGLVLVNTALIKWNYENEEGKRIINIIKWVGVFCIIYLTLLPLGGYRVYRPYIVRYDSIIPVTLTLIFAYGISTYFIIKNIVSTKFRTPYIIATVAVLLFYSSIDKHKLEYDDCERSALEQISNSEESVVLIEADCTIISWDKITDPYHSWASCQLLKVWGVIKGDKLYYQK